MPSDDYSLSSFASSTSNKTLAVSVPRQRFTEAMGRALLTGNGGIGPSFLAFASFVDSFHSVFEMRKCLALQPKTAAVLPALHRVRELPEDGRFFLASSLPCHSLQFLLRSEFENMRLHFTIKTPGMRSFALDPAGKASAHFCELYLSDLLEGVASTQKSSSEKTFIDLCLTSSVRCRSLTFPNCSRLRRVIFRDGRGPAEKREEVGTPLQQESDTSVLFWPEFWVVLSS